MNTNNIVPISIKAPQKSQKIEIINLLRGVAAFGVCFFHFSKTFTKYLDTNLMNNLAYYGSYGKYGVTIFFVISGFIIPFALNKRNYKVSNFTNFMKKRLIRLHPPLLAVIAVACTQEYLGTLINPNSEFPFSFNQIILNSLLISQYFNEFDFIKGIFWTLAIELEYYILIGLIFGLIIHSKKYIRGLTIFTLLAISLVAHSFDLPKRDYSYVISYLPLFCLGITTFYYKMKDLKSPYTFIALCLLIGLSHINNLSPENILFGWITSFLIAFIDLQKLPLLFTFLGNISYSLYLIHTTVGALVIYYGSKLPLVGNSQLLILALAIATAIGCAYLLYIFVEKPCMRYASKLKYSA